MLSRRKPGVWTVHCAWLALALLVVGAGVARAQDATPAPTAAPETTPDVAEAAGAEAAGAEGAATSVPTPAEAAAAAVPAIPRQVVVVDAITYGIAPVVGRVTSDQLRRTAAEMGYSILDQAVGVRAFRDLRLPYPPAPADLWRLGWATRSHRAVFARVWANEGRYVIEVIVASIDGTGPFVATESSGSEDLRAAVDRAVRQALPALGAWQGPEPTFGPARPGLGGVAVGTPGAVVVGSVMPQARRRTVREELGHPTARDGRRWRPAEPDIRRFSLALQTEASIGTTEGGFYNHYVGLRLDVRITRDILVGLYGAYVNLDGRDGRVSDFFFMLQAEDRIRPSSTLELTIPLRLGIGYLPFNGPVFRLAAGLNYALSPNWEIGADLVAPTFYVLPDRFAVAFDFALELGYRF
jgi:hypothetical protein